MKYPLHLLYVILFDAFLVHLVIVNGRGYYAVSKFGKLTQFYQRIRNSDRPSKEDEGDQPETRNDICYAIFNSSYFLDQGFKYVHPQDVFNKLKTTKYIETFKELFKSKTVDGSKTYVYKNSYVSKLIKIEYTEAMSIDFNDERPPMKSRKDKIENVVGYTPAPSEEWVLLCLTQKTVISEEMEFQKWYVTKRYNTKENDMTPDDVGVGGRFVFAPSGKRFDLEALAEIPARSFQSDLPNELFYLEQRKNREPAKSFSLDPLCQMVFEMESRNRLCTVILSSAWFSQSFKPIHDDTFLEYVCVRRKVVFTDKTAQEKSGQDLYIEWMIPCKAVRLFNPEESIWFVSRSYQSDMLFVFEENIGTNGEVILARIMKNVAIQDDGQPIQN